MTREQAEKRSSYSDGRYWQGLYHRALANSLITAILIAMHSKDFKQEDTYCANRH